MKKRYLRYIVTSIAMTGGIAVTLPLITSTTNNTSQTSELNLASVNQQSAYTKNTSQNIKLLTSKSSKSNLMQRVYYDIKRAPQTLKYTTYYNYRMQKSSDGKTWSNVEGTYGNGVLSPNMSLQNWHFTNFQHQFGRSFYDYKVRLVISYDWYEGETSSSKKGFVDYSNEITITKMDTSMVWEKEPKLISETTENGVSTLKYEFSFWMLENTKLSDYKFLLTNANDGSRIESNYKITKDGTHVAKVVFEFKKTSDDMRVNLGFEYSFLNAYGYDWRVVGRLDIKNDETKPPVTPPVDENVLEVSFDEVLSGISQIVQEKQLSSSALIYMSDDDKYINFGSLFKLDSKDEYDKRVKSMKFELVTSNYNKNMNVTIMLNSPYTFKGGDDYSIGSFEAYEYYYSNSDHVENDLDNTNNNLESKQNSSINSTSATTIALISVISIIVVLAFVWALVRFFKK